MKMKKTQEMIYMWHPTLRIFSRNRRPAASRNNKDFFVTRMANRKAKMGYTLRKMKWWYLAADPVFAEEMEYIKFSTEEESMDFERREFREKGFNLVK